MLVLSRLKNQSVLVPGLVTITVVDIRGDKVRLGFDAHEAVPVHRSEVWARIKAETPSVAAAAELQGNLVVRMRRLVALLEQPEVLLAMPPAQRLEISELIHGDGQQTEVP